VPALERWLEGTPLVIVEDGRALQDRLARSGVDVSDVLRAARSIPRERGAAPGQDRAAA
jgi:uncharacterized membrane protein YcaP (DUF421 family)